MSPEIKRRRLSKFDNLPMHMTTQLSNFDNKILSRKTNQNNITNETNASNTAAAAIFYNSMITAAGLSSNINSTTITKKISSVDLSLMGMSSSQMFYSPTSLTNFSSNVTNQIPLNVETTLPIYNDCGNNTLITSIAKNTNANLNNKSVSPNLWSNLFSKNIENKNVNKIENFSCNQIEKLSQQNVCTPISSQNLLTSTLPSPFLTPMTPLSEVSQNSNFFYFIINYIIKKK